MFFQGMSDLLSPILFVMKDESEAFWCFVSLMERLGPNFNRDQNGMHSQLFALSKVSLSGCWCKILVPFMGVFFNFCWINFIHHFTSDKRKFGM